MHIRLPTIVFRNLPSRGAEMLPIPPLMMATMRIRLIRFGLVRALAIATRLLAIDLMIAHWVPGWRRTSSSKEALSSSSTSESRAAMTKAVLRSPRKTPSRQSSDPRQFYPPSARSIGLASPDEVSLQSRPGPEEDNWAESAPPRRAEKGLYSAFLRIRLWGLMLLKPRVCAAQISCRGVKVLIPKTKSRARILGLLTGERRLLRVSDSFVCSS
jgi:hypothetical protein